MWLQLWCVHDGDCVASGAAPRLYEALASATRPTGQLVYVCRCALLCMHLLYITRCCARILNKMALVMYWEQMHNKGTNLQHAMDADGPPGSDASASGCRPVVRQFSAKTGTHRQLAD
jgi:hypothetical protein